LSILDNRAASTLTAHALKIARQMGGDLSYESPPDGGACFVLSLPTN